MGPAELVIAVVSAASGLAAMGSIIRVVKMRRDSDAFEYESAEALRLHRLHDAWDALALGAIEARQRGYERAKLEPWTPAEREALGVNDTEKFIRETDRVLEKLERERRDPAKEAEWAAISAQMEESNRRRLEEPESHSFGTHDQGESVIEAAAKISNMLEDVKVRSYEAGAEKVVDHLHYEIRKMSR